MKQKKIKFPSEVQFYKVWKKKQLFYIMCIHTCTSSHRSCAREWWIPGFKTVLSLGEKKGRGWKRHALGLHEVIFFKLRVCYIDVCYIIFMIFVYLNYFTILSYHPSIYPLWIIHVSIIYIFTSHHLSFAYLKHAQ